MGSYSESQQLFLKEPISQLRLSTKTEGFLDNKGISTVEELLMCCPEDPDTCECPQLHLLGIANFGDKCLQEVYEKLEVFGFVRISKPKKSNKRKKGVK